MASHGEGAAAAAVGDEAGQTLAARVCKHSVGVGLHKSNPVKTHTLKPPGFNPYVPIK
jgi:hypothetical protein